ncbi:glutamate ligase domain-containing protein, partial [Desulforamulus profundi]|uniref:glutamate ligase domain-containing protein n=1 Tax=Desulforamulus profundi TaxID=1383067 RepID=UPI0023678E4A
ITNRFNGGAIGTIIGKTQDILLDGAHNHAGALALKQALLESFPGRRFIFLLGMLADKERSKVVAELAPLARAVVVTRSNHPRAGDWTRLADHAKNYLEDVIVIEDVQEAVKAALDRTRQDDILCITGSLYMVAEARSVLGLSDKNHSGTAKPE